MSDGPPSYDTPCSATSCQSVPRYSEIAGCSERVLHSAPATPVTSRASAGREYVYKTDHLEISLGRSPWGLLYSTYGRDGIVNGIIKFTKKCSNTLQLSVKLEGTVTNSSAEQTTVVVPGVTKKLLMSEKVTLFSSIGEMIPLHKSFHFAIPFPNAIVGGHTPLPPSFSVFLPGATCDVSYALHVDIVRKGFRRHEMRTIPVLYLPKSRPTLPAVTSIPPVLPEHMVDDRIKSVELIPTWPKGAEPLSPTSREMPKVQLILPTPACFASGNSIPIALTINCPCAPAVPKLLTPNIGVFLIQRKEMWINSGRQISVREKLITRADKLRMTDVREGMRYLTVEIPAGEYGREFSWALDGAIRIEYFIRVIIRPPEYAKHLPVFKHDEVVALTTDQYGTLERELLTMDGTPMPALGLMRQAQGIPLR